MPRLKIITLLLSFSILIGCQKSIEVQSSIRDSVEQNQTVKTAVEWENSPAHPEFLFQKWNELLADPQTHDQVQKDVCAHLLELKPLQLTIFEVEIKKTENQELLGPCKEQLNKNLDDYYESQRAELPTNLNQKNWSAGFKFPENIQKRHVKDGYFTYTGEVGRKEVVLTFDDGPSDPYTKSILKSLKDMNAKAIFFNLGKNAKNNPAIVKQIAEGGHAIGSHSMNHFCLPASKVCRKNNGKILSQNEAISEIRSAHREIQKILGWVDPFFRFPYGESSPELRKYLKDNDVGNFSWNMDTEDWRAVSNKQLLAKALSELERAGKGILLFHDIQRKTAEIMPQFLKELYSRGYSVVLLRPSDVQERYNSRLSLTPNKP